MNSANRRDLASIISDLQSLLDEEQSKYDNLPEGLQASEKGETLQFGIDRMQEAIDALEQIS